MYRVEVDFMRAMLQNVAVIIKINSEKKLIVIKITREALKEPKCMHV